MPTPDQNTERPDQLVTSAAERSERVVQAQQAAEWAAVMGDDRVLAAELQKVNEGMLDIVNPALKTGKLSNGESFSDEFRSVLEGNRSSYLDSKHEWEAVAMTGEIGEASQEKLDGFKEATREQIENVLFGGWSGPAADHYRELGKKLIERGLSPKSK